MNIHDENFRRMGYFIIFVVCLIIVTLLITIGSYVCTLPYISPTRPPQLVARDTNHATINVVAEPTNQPSRLDDQNVTNLCRSYDQNGTLPYLSEVKLCNSKNINSSSSCCCSICLMDYKEADLLRMLPGCGHLFHVMCVDPWLRMNLTCPVCRKTYQSV
jgi:hypothetical protein